MRRAFANPSQRLTSLQEQPWGPAPRPVPTAQLSSSVGPMDLSAFHRFELRTDRLLIRLPRESDVAALHAYRSIPEVCRYVPFEPQSPDEVLARVRAAEAQLDADAPIAWAVMIDVDSESLVGDVILMTPSVEHHCGEVGYVVSPDHAGRGYATEAAAAAVDFGFGAVGMHRIIGRVDTRNTASARVLERIGMRREAHLIQNEWFKGEWTDEWNYAVLADEWNRRPVAADR
jgi:RimJ/RimL family protein N-acetyltransferase